MTSIAFAAVSNPFCTRFVRPGALAYRCPDRPHDDLATARLVSGIVTGLQQCGSGLVVGPHGSGKSTLLRALCHDLQERLGEVELLQLPAAAAEPSWIASLCHSRRVSKHVEARLPSMGRGGVLVIDGAEQLRPRGLRRIACCLRRSGRYLLATSHAPIDGIPLLYRTVVDAALIEVLTETLIKDVEPSVAGVVRRYLADQDLKERNLRDLWFDCYDVVQDNVASHRDR